MSEKVFKVMGHAGATSIVMGVIVMAIGLIGGTLNIVYGVQLLKSRKDVIF